MSAGADGGATSGAKCIYARRSLGYIPHTALRVNVLLRASCEGVECSPDQTCKAGLCVSSEIDPTKFL
jgi:hypothetical protein